MTDISPPPCLHSEEVSKFQDIRSNIENLIEYGLLAHKNREVLFPNREPASQWKPGSGALPGEGARENAPGPLTGDTRVGLFVFNHDSFLSCIHVSSFLCHS